MIVLYTIYSNIQQYALIDVQLNEKNPAVATLYTTKTANITCQHID